MKSIFVRISVLFVATLGIAAVPAVADEAAELEVVRATVANLFSGIEADDIYASDVDGWYTVRKGAIVAYISADGRYLLQGDLIDLEQQVNLSEQDRNKSRVKTMMQVGDEDVIVFTPDTVRHTISVFTDIDCTFCRRLHSQMDEYMDEGIEIRYFL